MMGSNALWSKIVALCAVLGLTTSAVAQIPLNVRVVDSNATGVPIDGRTWNTAFRNPQDGLADMNPSQGINELWVAAGTYRPDQGGGQTPGDPNASFVLLNGVGVYAGFLGTAYGGNETMRSQRNPEKNTTTLSGDVGVPGDPSDNSVQIVTAQSVGPTAMTGWPAMSRTARKGNTKNRNLILIRKRMVENPPLLPEWIGLSQSTSRDLMITPNCPGVSRSR